MDYFGKSPLGVDVVVRISSPSDPLSGEDVTIFFKICSVSVIITSDMDEEMPDEQQNLWMMSASSPAFLLES